MGKTRGVHETTPEIRNRMVGMYEAGLGLREIAAAVNCSQRTVKRWLNRFDREGNVETKERCGRKRATTKEQDEAIIQLATQTPITAAKSVLPALGLKCSVDTVRERLHRAGIHNWTPSKKHIQKIPIASTDGAGIQQAVWRPTGTQLGKKKSAKETAKPRNVDSSQKKKVVPQKSKKVSDSDGPSIVTIESSSEQQSFPTTFQNGQPQINEMQNVPLQSQSTTLHPVISTNPSQYSHQLNLIPPQSQPIYHHHSGLDISQNWPLDLVQNTHHYPQNQQNSLHIDHHSVVHIQHQPQLHNQHDPQIPQHIEHIHSSIHPQSLELTQRNVHEHQNLTNLSQERINESQDIINVCSDVCSNSNCSSIGNSQNSSADDEVSSDNNCSPSKGWKKGRIKKKKGGKVKGTLETSIEIRNRMIGMSEAGLSTLSIALAINRSERTVKRWLDRWHKEGNVQTKERKGRKRITTKEEDDAIIAMATQQPLTAAKHVAPALGLKCSVDTIRERLHKAGIHSWKLGKKQGEGNTVHTVHLWQPSGNRSNKVKASGSDRKRRSLNKKRSTKDINGTKQSNKEQNIESLPSRNPLASSNVIPEENLQFGSPSQTSSMIQTSHELVDSPTNLMQPTPLICSQGPTAPQAIQAMGPIIPQRPDCRLALPNIVPAIPNQPSAYSSCMMGSNSHAAHIEQTDPMNYEPYIWSF